MKKILVFWVGVLSLALVSCNNLGLTDKTELTITCTATGTKS